MPMSKALKACVQLSAESLALIPDYVQHANANRLKIDEDISKFYNMLTVEKGNDFIQV